MTKILGFKIEVLEDLSLPSGSNRGQNGILDFIPGRIFLGIAGQHYQSFQNQQLDWDVFFSGKVRFLDARLNDDHDGVCIPMPLSIHTPKKQELKAWTREAFNEKQAFNFGKTPIDERGSSHTGTQVSLFERSVSTYGAFGKCEHHYALKTAIDHQSGTSADGKLFGIASIKAGVSFSMNIEVDEHPQQALIISLLEKCFLVNQGYHRIGQSRSAEYGAIQIQPSNSQVFEYNFAWQKIPYALQSALELKKSHVTHPSAIHNTLIYELQQKSYVDHPGQAVKLFAHPHRPDHYLLSFLLLSDTVLIDPKTAQPTMNPKAVDFGLSPQFFFDIEYSFIRKVSWHLYHGTYQRPDLERHALKAGSVVAFSISHTALLAANTTLNAQINGSIVKMMQGVGSYRSEGLGQVVLNHELLEFKEIKSSTNTANLFPSLKYPKAKQATLQQTISLPKGRLAQWLNAKRFDLALTNSVQRLVNLVFEAEFKRFCSNGPGASQWSIVAEIAQSYCYKELGYMLLKKHLIGDFNDTSLTGKEEDKKPLLLRGVSKKHWGIEVSYTKDQLVTGRFSKAGLAVAFVLQPEYIDELKQKNEYRAEYEKVSVLLDQNLKAEQQQLLNHSPSTDQKSLTRSQQNTLIPMFLSLLAKKMADHIKFTGVRSQS